MTPGTVITLTATVSSSGGAVQRGVVDFCDASANYCTDVHKVGSAQVTASGSAIVRFIPSLGSHTYKAVFEGFNGDASSTSPAVSIAVQQSGTTKSGTTLDLQASGSPGNYTLTATAFGSGTATPSGTVSFLDTTNANYVLGTANLGVGASGLQLAKSVFPTATNPIEIVTADFNKDGIPDLAVSMYDLSTFNQTGALVVFLGNGDGTFRLSATYAANSYPYNIAVCDLDADGNVDLAITDSASGKLTILLGKGDGTFTQRILAMPEAGYGPIVAGDINNDGIPDLITQGFDQNFNAHLTILTGTGGANFTVTDVQQPSGNDACQLMLVDVNHDGNLDLVTCNSDHRNQGIPSTLRVSLGNGDGTFQTQQIFPAGANAGYMAAADFNGDGNLDFVIPNSTGINLTLFLGNGDGTFNASQIPGAGFAPGSVSTADFNGDGIPDISVITAAAGYDNIHLLLGNGDGTFTTVTGPFSGADPLASVTADFNGDGIPDLAEVDLYDKTISVFLTSRGGAATATVSGISPVGTGTHFAQATYGGDTINSGSVSQLVPLTAEKQQVKLSLTATPSSIAVGQNVTLTATFAPTTAQGHTAGGQITFLNGSAMLVTNPAVNGTATAVVSSLPVGTNNLTAAYSGDDNFATATSVVVPVTVGGPVAPSGLALQLSSPMVTLVTGHHTTIQVTGVSTNYVGTVHFSIGLEPVFSTFIARPSSLTFLGSGTQTALLYIDTDAVLGYYAALDTHTRGSRKVEGFFACAVPLFMLAGVSRRNRRRILSLLSLLVLGSTMMLAGCSSKYPASTPPGTYPLQILAVDSIGSVQARAPLTLIVTP